MNTGQQATEAPTGGAGEAGTGTGAGTGSGETGTPPELTVIVISYNTRELTLKCLETLYATTKLTGFRTVVLDNASGDGSVEAIAAAYPQVELIASADNLGFAAGNNQVAATAETDWLLLLNPDTEVHEGAVDNLLAFAQANPDAGITGGRTVFPDGSLNPGSCWNRITPWSAFCMATGLTAVFRGSSRFNPEGLGGWHRDSVRAVDIVQGSFLMIPRALWNELGGFDLKYFMYGEESDLCLRAQALGYQPKITPEAQIMHLAGASSPRKSNKIVMVAKARFTLMCEHWPAAQVPLGWALMWLWGGLRRGGSWAMGKAAPGRYQEAAEKWREVWARRKEWLSPYDPV